MFAKYSISWAQAQTTQSQFIVRENHWLRSSNCSRSGQCYKITDNNRRKEWKWLRFQSTDPNLKQSVSFVAFGLLVNFDWTHLCDSEGNLSKKKEHKMLWRVDNAIDKTKVEGKMNRIYMHPLRCVLDL